MIPVAATGTGNTSEVVIHTEEMNELSVVNGFSDGVQRGVAELSHLFLTEGLALLSEELGHHVFLDVPGVLRVQRPEGGQQVLVSCGQELLLEDYPERGRGVMQLLTGVCCVLSIP